MYIRHIFSKAIQRQQPIGVLFLVIAVEGLYHRIAMESVLVQLNLLVQIARQILVEAELAVEGLRELNTQEAGCSLLKEERTHQGGLTHHA